ncbi:MAG: gamma-glutamyltransferase, partial [Thermoanaerobaculia bacterium]|nr:gamma-glutamyltransferase [Thermoanaerobaculia bacterium]
MRFGLAGALIALMLCTMSLSASVVAETAAVSTPETLATSTALNVMRSGGTAADAAVAAAFTLSVLRPGTAGIGGGGTALYFDAATEDVWALDFRPAAPNAAYVEGERREAVTPLAVPGFPAGLGALH